MRIFRVGTIRDQEKMVYYIWDEIDATIIEEPTKYLKSKMKLHRSPYTVKRLAYVLTYYLRYLQILNLTVEKILKMKYAEQLAHFAGFLQWCKEGKHCQKGKGANNNTCNSYLQTVLGFYVFFIQQYPTEGSLKVIIRVTHNYTNQAGVKFEKIVNKFDGYLPRDISRGKTIQKEDLIDAIKACSNNRNKLILIMLAETGMRIGELLGIRYTTDIDLKNHIIKVVPRDDNENDARSKYAERRNCKISKNTVDLLLTYMTENRKILGHTEYLFVVLHGPTTGRPLNRNTVESIFKNIIRQTKIKITPHMERHYFADARYQYGWRLHEISEALGHKHMETTMSYLQMHEKELSDAMDDYFDHTEELYELGKLY